MTCGAAFSSKVLGSSGLFCGFSIGPSIWTIRCPTSSTADQQEHCFAVGAAEKPVFDAFDDRHGRLARRRVFICPQAAGLEALDAWSGLRTVLAVESICSVNGSGTVAAEI